MWLHPARWKMTVSGYFRRLSLWSRALDGVSRALTIALHPDAFFTTQYAGNMEARFADIDCLLLQSWSEDDFVRMQENLIGHLLTQKQLKLPPRVS